ncbi:MAG TPA: DUF815 domain-containing protein, partial [bacterium]|nr:DUF815 domain-containing protein [bacterium]
MLAGLFEDEVGLAFRKGLKGLEKGAAAGRAARYYRQLWDGLAQRQEFNRHAAVGDGLQDHWLERLLDQPNAFHRKAELADPAKIGPALREAYAAELDLFLGVLRADWAKAFRAAAPGLPPLSGFKPLEPLEASPAARARRDLKEALLRSGRRGADLAPEVAGHFRRNGLGLFGRYRAFRWDHASQSLRGVGAVDPIELSNLVGYDEQRRPLLDNVRAFVAGRPANNALLYGERGTGKSSTVKALLNAHQEEGLRLVEVLSAHLMDFPAILSHLRGRPEKFILFVDDLSFEENETAYKGLKAVLEGTLEAPPKNVIL